MSLSNERRYPVALSIVTAAALFFFAPRAITGYLSELAGVASSAGGALFGVLISAALFFMSSSAPGIVRLQNSQYNNELLRYITEGAVTAFAVMGFGGILAVVPLPRAWAFVSTVVLISLMVWMLLASFRLLVVIRAIWRMWPSSKR